MCIPLYILLLRYCTVHTIAALLHCTYLRYCIVHTIAALLHCTYYCCAIALHILHTTLLDMRCISHTVLLNMHCIVHTYSQDTYSQYSHPCVLDMHCIAHTHSRHTYSQYSHPCADARTSCTAHKYINYHQVTRVCTSSHTHVTSSHTHMVETGWGGGVGTPPGLRAP